MAHEDETDRLSLHRPRLCDAPDLLRFFADAEAMRYTLYFSGLKACRRHIAGHHRQRKQIGYGPWTIRLKSDRRIIGFGGLYDDPFDPGWGPEIAYHFDPTVWGRGYASELTRYCLDFAHGVLAIQTVKAFAHRDNAASRRVLEKTGFKKERFIADMNRYLYAPNA